MSATSVATWLSLLAFCIQFNDAFDRGSSSYYFPDRRQSCGCLYNVFANLPEAERLRSGCVKTCNYRTIDGSCNNRCNIKWGQAFTPFGRLLEPDYCTSKAPDAPRCARDGRPLPNSRALSVRFFQDRPPNVMDKFLTLAHMAFGQFLSHDIGRTNEPKMTDENGNDLCGANQCNQNDVCFPIQVLTGDPDFPPTQCLRFHRSTRSRNPKYNRKDQQNDVSSYIDLNTIYGSRIDATDIIREARGELSAYLNMTDQSLLGDLNTGGKPLLPQTDGVKCFGQTEQIKCFFAGDRRVVEQPQLTTFHTILAREHNRLVDELAKINPCWSQERLFREARKIGIGQYQYIVYNEYIPLLVSQATIDRFQLRLKDSGFTNIYDPKVNVTTSNAFQTASFRFGHTQIPEVLPLATNNFNIFERKLFSEVFFNPTLIYKNGRTDVTPVDSIVFGMIALSAEAADKFFNPQLTRSFEAMERNALGRDLEAIDIERGRDHGLPGYNDFREWCGLSRAATFNDLVDIPIPHRTKLMDSYDHVDDIDLFLGAMLETIPTGEISGPLFTCLNAEQFGRYKFGDRFWHEEYPNGFTEEQLQSIRTSTMARIFCDNLDNPSTMQPNVLAHPRSVARSLVTDVTSQWTESLVYDVKLGHDNERVPCNSLPRLDMNLWRERNCWNPNCENR